MNKLFFIALGLIASLAYADFKASGPFTADQESALQFLEKIPQIPYTIDDIVKFDILNPKHTFMFETKNGDICRGNTITKKLSCKNKTGADGFSFDGDAD